MRTATAMPLIAPAAAIGARRPIALPRADAGRLRATLLLGGALRLWLPRRSWRALLLRRPLLLRWPLPLRPLIARWPLGARRNRRQ